MENKTLLDTHDKTMYSYMKSRRSIPGQMVQTLQNSQTRSVCSSH